MAKEFTRSQRVAHQIQKSLAMYLEKNRVHTGGGLLTISSIDVSPDLKNACVYVTLLGNDEAIKPTIEQLNADKASYQHYLGSVLKLRVTPKLRFQYDTSLEQANRVTDLIDKLEHPSE